MTQPQFTIQWSDQALNMLAAIKDKRIQQKIYERVSGLALEPEKQGNSLAAELADYRSLRAVGQRYRIIYKVDGEKVLVLVLAVGIRKEGDKKDIYNLAKRLVRLGLLEPKEEKSDINEMEEKPQPNQTDEQPAE